MSESLQIHSFSPSTLVASGTEKQETSQKIAETIARAADDRKGADILLLQVAQVSYLADYFVIITGFSKVQVRAICQSIEEKVALEWQRRPVRVEGEAEGSWVLMDYGDVIVHILLPKEREFYNLEAFWGHGERTNYKADIPVGE